MKSKTVHKLHYSLNVVTKLAIFQYKNTHIKLLQNFIKITDSRKFIQCWITRTVKEVDKIDRNTKQTWNQLVNKAYSIFIIYFVQHDIERTSSELGNISQNATSPPTTIPWQPVKANTCYLMNNADYVR